MNNSNLSNDEINEQIEQLKDHFSNLLDQTMTNALALQSFMQITNQRLTLIEKKLEPENPGDINTLYQNWNKKPN